MKTAFYMEQKFSTSARQVSETSALLAGFFHFTDNLFYIHFEKIYFVIVNKLKKMHEINIFYDFSLTVPRVNTAANIHFLY